MDANEFRAVGHEVVDLLAEYLQHVEERPVFPDVEPDRMDTLFDEPVPATGGTAATVLEEMRSKLLPYCTGVNHPGYFGLITPTPLPIGAVGDLIASVLNQNLGEYTIGPSAVAMERRVVRWLCDLVGFGAPAGGNLTSGGMMANFLGLKLARDRVSGDTAQHEGVAGPWAVYTSEERHVSVDKAVDCVGIGRNALRALPTDDAFRVRLDTLEEAIADDRRRGVRPMAIVGMAGTTNTGAVDDLVALLADSVTIDPHKWFFAPLDAGALLVRDADRLTASFGLRPPYLTQHSEGTAGRYQYYVHGFEQSRRFRGLKVWMSLKRYGTTQIGRWIDANCAHALHLWERVESDPEFRSAVRPPMSAICIRYEPSGDAIPEEDLAALHHEVAGRVEASGRFWIGTTQLKGLTWFRINPVNFRTRTEHMDDLLELLRVECRRLRPEHSGRAVS
jgi:glutamate/tyrosine decarboxylase-like PLP-dependent enzyme